MSRREPSLTSGIASTGPRYCEGSTYGSGPLVLVHEPADSTIRGDVGHLDQIRTWFGRPLWDMEPADADAYFGKVLRDAPNGGRLARSQALTSKA
ncbi:hypothetical protein [Streptomyces sp. NPDC057460]|uniref:hypothetical protein n=1 Tax=Streptomyces sp. NPDC057460 TaxID=3346141 RepID=UPI0036959DF2